MTVDFFFRTFGRRLLLFFIYKSQNIEIVLIFVLHLKLTISSRVRKIDSNFILLVDESLQSLKLEIANLTKLVEQGAVSAGQDTRFRFNFEFKKL